MKYANYAAMADVGIALNAVFQDAIICFTPFVAAKWACTWNFVLQLIRSADTMLSHFARSTLARCWECAV